MLWTLVSSTEANKLFNHVGRIAEADSWEEAPKKILRGIAGQTNQAKQGKKEVNGTTSSQGRPESIEVAKSGDEVKNLGKHPGKQIEANTCDTSTRRPMGGGHDKEAECYDSRLIGHIKEAMACKERPARK